jgi:hypothetical protein
MPDMFWCASYIDIMGKMEDLPYEVCPTCNDNEIDRYQSRTMNIIFEYTATRGVVLNPLAATWTITSLKLTHRKLT